MIEFQAMNDSELIDVLITRINQLKLHSSGFGMLQEMSRVIQIVHEIQERNIKASATWLSNK